MSDLDTQSPFIHQPDPDNPGWMTWNLRDSERFNAFLGSILVRPAENGLARVRMLPERRHSNLGDAVHGGVTLGFLDICMFAGSRMLGVDLSGRGVTVEMSTQFTAAGRLGVPMEAEVECVRETRSLIFLRGKLLQDWAGDGNEIVIANFSGIIKRGMPVSRPDA